MKITKASYLLRFFNKTSASVLFLEFQYFELRNIYKRIPSPIRILILSSELASSLIDSGVGLVLSSYMVRFSRSIEQRKQIYSCEANSLGVVWCSYNERTNCSHVYKLLLSMSTTQSQTSVSQTTSHQSLLSTEDTSPFFSQEESPFVAQDISYENQSPLTSQGTHSLFHKVHHQHQLFKLLALRYPHHLLIKLIILFICHNEW